MSTTAEIDRMPLRSRRRFIQAGVGASRRSPRSRDTKRGHASGSSTCTARCRRLVTGVVAALGGLSGAPVTAATSRAMPRIDRQSARFGVILSVMSASSRSRRSRTLAPTGRRPATRASPQHRRRCRARWPSTACLAIRRRAWSWPRCEVRPAGWRRRSRRAPSCPRRRSARRRRCAGRRAPMSTRHKRRRSALGCGST